MPLKERDSWIEILKPDGCCEGTVQKPAPAGKT
jgi:hypothetical protein